MTDILFKCPKCSKHLAVDGVAQGKVVNCVDCGQPIQVPMSAIVFRCPSCDWELSAPSDIAGKVFNCPNCKGDLSIPSPARTARISLSLRRPVSAERPSSDPSTTKAQVGRCPACNKALSKDAVVCVSCGLDLRTGEQWKPSGGSKTYPSDDIYRAPTPEQVVEKPGSVMVAVALIYGQVALTVLGFIVDWLTVGTAAMTLPNRNDIFGFFIELTLARGVNAGRNWARILNLVLTVIAVIVVPLILFLFPETLATDRPSVIGMILGIAMSLAASVLSFTPTANAWFRARPRREDGRATSGWVKAIGVVLFLFILWGWGGWLSPKGEKKAAEAPKVEQQASDKLTFKAEGYSIAPLAEGQNGTNMFLPATDGFAPNVNIQIQAY